MAHEKNPVMVAVGGSADEAAIAFGVAEARRRGAGLQLAHVVPIHLPLGPLGSLGALEFREIGEQVLQKAKELVADLAPELEVSTRLGHGSPVRELCASSADAQLVVVGRGRHRGPLAAWSGRTAVGVSSHSSAPVAVVPAGWTAGPLDTVLVGVTAETLGVDALGETLADLSSRGASLVALHSWVVPDPYVDIAALRTHSRDWEEEGERTVTEVLEAALQAHPETKVDIEVRHGYPGQVLIEAAADADLVVLPRRRHLLAVHGHLGSTARELIHRLTTPVLVLPPGPHRHGSEEQATRASA
ncbi:universal stress protein [Nocardioides coralli]|uniref:universal stress protein n=1 Tax=Nocardioides coralli TaxID=2872154 RepID=UPI001CA3B194|nr:universal stress protein [Nocardioides coralli]QZY30361.1 universal stress protein [Nocardioides coralli]